MNYETIKLHKDMYKAPGGFKASLEALDPTHAYKGTELGALDAFQRQLKRFDIKVGGASSDIIAKFFQTPDSSALFPEYVSRAVEQGAQDSGILSEIIASKTEVNSPDYRSITTDLDSKDYSAAIPEGTAIPETNITLNEQLVKLKKQGRLLRASYEAIKFQRIDVFTVALKQIGAYIAKAQLKDAVGVLLGGGGLGAQAERITISGAKVAYSDLLDLWGKFDEFGMNVMLASPDMMMDLLSISEFKDPATGLNFQATGSLTTPLGATLLKSNAVPAGTIIGLDKNFALEMVTAGGISFEYDKLIDTQLERAAVTAIAGFSKIFPDAVKVLVRE
ncbi:MAG: phage major capsid protein [Oscillospiraceae bacterium]|nr:phage major capsid protein [Oscillospiraceae bacterium]